MNFDIEPYIKPDDDNEFITKHLVYFNATRKRINLMVSEEIIEDRNIKDYYQLESTTTLKSDMKEFIAEPYMDGHKVQKTNDNVLTWL